jgi:hypothetical protein
MPCAVLTGAAVLLAGVLAGAAEAEGPSPAGGRDAPARASQEAGRETPGTREIAFDAIEKSYDPGPPERFLLRGSAWAECEGVRVEAVGVVLEPRSGELYAEGPVVLKDSSRGTELRSASLAYNIRTHRGLAEEARLVYRPPRKGRGPGRIERGEVAVFVVRADVIRREGRDLFRAEEVTITSCDFARPHWRLRSRRVEVVPGHQLRARGNTLYLGRVPVFHLPLYRADLSPGARHMSISLRAGSSDRWGEATRLRLGWPFRRPRPPPPCDLDMWGLALGHRETRGAEWGAFLRWKGTRAVGHAEADFFLERGTPEPVDLERASRARLRPASKIEGSPVSIAPSSWLAGGRYALFKSGEPELDAATLESAAPLEHFSYRGGTRSYSELAHRAEIGPGWELETRVSSATDRAVRQEYLERDAKTGLPDVSFIDLRSRPGASFLSLYTGFRTYPFRTETEYLPELRWTAPAASLGGGVVLSTEATAGYLRRRKDELLGLLAGAVDPEAAEDYDAFRARVRAVVSRPLRLGPVSVAPYVGTDQALYDGSARDGDAFVRGAAVYGASVGTRLFGRLRGGERPLRHVIEARAEYAGVSEPTRDPVTVLGFDRSDDLAETSRVLLRLDQRLQTKRGGAGGLRRPHDLAGLLLDAEYYADPDEAGRLLTPGVPDGRRWGPLRGVLFVSPSPGFRAFSGIEWDLEDGVTRASESGVVLGGSTGPAGDPGTASWRFGVFHVYTHTPGADSSSELGVRLSFAPAGRWRLDAAGRYRLEGPAAAGPEWTDHAVSLVRDFHDWDVSFRVWRDRAENDYGVSVGIRPKGFPVNLPP